MSDPRCPGDGTVHPQNRPKCRSCEERHHVEPYEGDSGDWICTRCVVTFWEGADAK